MVMGLLPAAAIPVVRSSRAGPMATKVLVEPSPLRARYGRNLKLGRWASQ